MPSLDESPSLLQSSFEPSRSTFGSRPPGGLGQGLARILRRSGGGSRSAHGQRGLQQLLGRGLPSTSRLVRDFVVETALGAIADGFEAEAVVIARRDGSGHLAVVSSRIPPSWEQATSLTFELFGMLWYWLDHASYTYGRRAQPGGEEPEGEAGPLGVGGRHLWIGCQPVAAGHLAAAVVRGSSFTEVEQVTLNRLVRSVAVTLEGTASVLPPGASVAVTGEAGDGWAVEVGLEMEGERQRASASGPTQELAAARAALTLCPAAGEACEVTFAGQTELDGSRVTIVLVDEAEGSPLLGLAISDPGDLTGAVEAVFAAVGTSGAAGRD